MFGQEWTKRWDKHATIPEDAWTPVLNAIDHILPQAQPMPKTEIDLERWRHSLRRKPCRAAGSVSRNDLLQMPDDLTSQLLAILREAETTGRWLLQIVEGFVVALE